MELEELSQTFSNAISTTLDSEGTMTLRYVENLINILKKFSKFSMNSDAAQLFMQQVVKFIVFLNHYSRLSEENELIKCSMLRNALSVLMYVIEKTNISTFIAKKIRKIIDAIIPVLSQFSTIREFLRFYLIFLHKLAPKIVKSLALKHTSFSVLHKVFNESCDIETQAIIIELVFTFCKCDCSSVFDKTFLNLIQLCTDESTIYQNIRMILDQVNENSYKIFSINCSDIEMNSRRVLEFEGSRCIDDIWLDINLTEHKLSFFCTKNFANSITKLDFVSYLSSWVVLSFSVGDILQADYSYNNTTENLTLSFVINLSKFNMYVNAPGRELLLEICISRYSDRFSKLTNVILPQLFPNLFSVNFLNAQYEKDTNAFKKARKLSTLKKHTTPLDAETDSLQPVINSSIDSSNLSEKIFNGNVSFKHISRETSNKNNKEDKLIVKRFNSGRAHRSLLNKSVSPVSFTESVLGRKEIKLKKISKAKESFQKNLKVSVPKQYKKLKISTFNENTDTVTKIKKKKLSTVEEKKISNEEQDALDDLEMEEAMREPIFNDNLVDNALNNSNSKVADWLQNKVDYEAAEVEKTVEDVEILQFLDDANTVVPPSVSARNSQNNDLLPEEQLRLMMLDDIVTQEKVTNINDELESLTSKKLLEVLCSQENQLNRSSQNTKEKCCEAENKDVICVEDDGNMDKSDLERFKSNIEKNLNSELIDHISTDSSDVPLCELAKTIKENKLIVSKVCKDSIESKNDFIQESANLVVNESQKCLLSENEIDVNKSFKEIDKLDNIDNLDDSDRTPDLEEILASNVAAKIPLISNKGEDLNLTKNTEISLLAKKRKLYNPLDYSYLENIITDDYIKSKDKTPELKPKNIVHLIRSGSSKHKSNKTKRKQSKKPKKNKIKNEKSYKYLTTRKVSIENKNSLKSFLQEKIDEQKEITKKRKLLHKHAESSTSSASMEPFGNLVREIEKKKEIENFTKIKRNVNDTDTESKIRIISDVLIHPGKCEVPKIYQTCCKDVFVKMSKNYLDLIQHVSYCNPQLLSSEDCNAILGIFKNYNKQ